MQHIIHTFDQKVCIMNNAAHDMLSNIWHICVIFGIFSP